jgi:hypothetical protein
MRVVLVVLLLVTLINGQGYYQMPIQNYQSAYYRPPPQQQAVSSASNVFYAKVYPLSSDGHQNSKPFTGYLLPLQGAYQGYYQVLCTRESGGESVAVLKNKLNQLDKKVKSLTDDYNRLANQKTTNTQSVSNQDLDDSEVNQGLDDSEVFDVFSQPKKGNVFQQQIFSNNAKIPSVIQQQSNNGNSVQQISNGGNVNTNSNVMQCEGVTCPKGTVECKIVEKSNEPNHETITTTIYCMDGNQKTLKEEKNTKPNPQKGSSFNNSRTIGGNQNNELFQKMHDEMDETFGAAKSQQSQSMGDMQKQMKSIFSSGFFANNPFMQQNVS